MQLTMKKQNLHNMTSRVKTYGNQELFEEEEGENLKMTFGK